jgi:asparagine synthase (glutamine-hydrolysing)
MCGFVGIINKSHRKVDPVVLKEMADAVSHRKNGDEGVFFDKNIGFYHKSSSIIDFSPGQQPVTHDNVTLVYNGELYNYMELRENLLKRNVSLKSASDTEIIISLYREMGEDFMKTLTGMFAFILYDHMDQKLLVARDHLGIKPLYWYQDEHILIFSTEINSITRHPEVDARPDEREINEYFPSQFAMGEETMIENVFKVLPGYYMVFECEGFGVKRRKIKRGVMEVVGK